MSEGLGHVVPKPILPVADMEAAIGFYRQVGFDVASYDDGYAWVRHRGEEVVHLRNVPDLDTAANRSSAYLHVHDANAWHEAMGAMGATIGPVADMAWGMREFSFTDPSGNLIRVGQNL